MPFVIILDPLDKPSFGSIAKWGVFERLSPWYELHLRLSFEAIVFIEFTLGLKTSTFLRDATSVASLCNSLLNAKFSDFNNELSFKLLFKLMPVLLLSLKLILLLPITEWFVVMSFITLPLESLPESLSLLLFFALCRNLNGNEANDDIFNGKVSGQLAVVFVGEETDNADKPCGEYVSDVVDMFDVFDVGDVVNSDEDSDCDAGDEEEA